MPAAPLDPRHAVYVGSFDPMTLGHVDLIRRGAQIFSRLTVGIGVNPDKSPLFTPDERLAQAKQVLAPLANVEILCFTGLAVDFVKDRGAAVMLRGLRTLTDMESEFRMTLANHQLEPNVETVFLMAGERYTHISSTLIKQVAKMGREDEQAQLEAFVPREIIPALLEKYRGRGGRDEYPE